MPCGVDNILVSSRVATGPFSIASNLVGFQNLLYEVADDPDQVGDCHV